MVDNYRVCFYKMRESKNQFHEALLQFESYEKCLIYRQDDMQSHEISVDKTKLCRSNKKWPPTILTNI